MRAHLRTFLIVGLALVLLAWFLRHANLAGVWHEIAGGRLDLLALALGFTILTYTLRALRWQYLLAGLGRTRFSTAFRATVIGFAASFLLPARAGEFLRPYLLAKRENLGFTATFATVILERVLDAVTVLLLFAVFLLFDPSLSRADPAAVKAVTGGGLVAACGAGAILVVFFFLAGHPDKLGRVSLKAEAVLPARVAQRLARLLQTFAEGLGAVRRLPQLLMVMAWSLPLWLSIAAGIMLVTRAFHITVSFVGSFLIMTVLVVGVAVPTPGAVGGFHEAYRIAATSFFQTPNDRAIGAAIVLHAISFVPVTILGIVFMAREGLTLGRMRRLADERAGAGEAVK